MKRAMPDASPFISSVARREVDRILARQRLLIYVQCLVIVVQCGVIVTLLVSG